MTVWSASLPKANSNIPLQCHEFRHEYPAVLYKHLPDWEGEKQLTVLSSHLLSIKKLRPFEFNLL